jgi:hypothetical protein
MWNTKPRWESGALPKIKCPVWIVDGDHEIDVERNQADAMAAWTLFTGQLILPPGWVRSLAGRHEILQLCYGVLLGHEV